MAITAIYEIMILLIAKKFNIQVKKSIIICDKMRY